ncbi:MAG: hypothetical protein ABJ061_10105, partial [Marinobacter sp.]|uniref:hypothetical protein n=1 Tax=Marinobacter sp. TaxID=50741 RepID=UPI003298DC24
TTAAGDGAGVGEHAGVTEAALVGLLPLPAFAGPDLGRRGGRTVSLLGFGVAQAAERDVSGTAGPMGRRDGGEGLHRRGVGPMVAAGVGDTTQVERECLEVISDQSRQPGQVRRGIGDRKVLHHVIVEDRAPPGDLRRLVGVRGTRS